MDLSVFNYLIPLTIVEQMPKRKREPNIDEASEELIASIQDADALENGLRNFKAEKATIQTVFEDAENDILAEFKTDDPQTLPERDQIRFNTKLKFEEGLRDDRLQEINEKISEYKQKHFDKCTSRKRQRVVDRQIAECEEFIHEDPQDSDWKLIGKVKHVQIVLNDKVGAMSSNQKQKYANVLTELKKKGWRVLRTHNADE